PSTYVLSIVLGNGFADDYSWMRSNFPAKFPILVNLTKISIESTSWLWWILFPIALKTALQTTFSLPSLTSIRLLRFRFKHSTELISLLRSSRNLHSLVLSTVSILDGEQSGAAEKHMGLSLLELNSSDLPLLHTTFDLPNLQHLHTTLNLPEMEVETQHILDANSKTLRHYHVHLSYFQTDNSISLRNLSYLDTLEMTTIFDFPSDQDKFILWMGNILETSQDPNNIQQAWSVLALSFGRSSGPLDSAKDARFAEGDRHSRRPSLGFQYLRQRYCARYP
ncbi:hypothetical protein B0H11DRAFT_2040770, partial [Mycena galericulata]